jgi:glycosyltransferase involved in cell wall biosynthesis
MNVSNTLLVGKQQSSSSYIKRDCLMLFDLSIRGHHPNYIQQLIEYWNTNYVSGRLEIVVSPRFLEEHSDVVELANRLERREEIRFSAISSQEEVALKPRNSFINRTQRAFQELNLLRKYAAVVNATHCLIMYFDPYQIPLAVGYNLPYSFSGIYFRPTFHYGEFSNYQPSWKERLQQWREKITLARVLNHPNCHRLFCLDLFAVQYLQNCGKNQVVHLSDPITIYQRESTQIYKLKTRLGIEPGRQVFLLFGALTERKGIYQLLDAVALLPSDLCKQLCVLLVGKSDLVTSLETRIAALCQTKPVQIVRQYEFLPEQDIPAYFDLADVVLAPYQRHVGMSGILLWAAATQKPVLSSNYGLMGELVKQYELGLAVDSTMPSEIAQGLTQFFTESPANVGDHQKMQQFAEQNSSETYARVIFQSIYQENGSN